MFMAIFHNTLGLYLTPDAIIPFWILGHCSLFTLVKIAPLHPNFSTYVKVHMRRRFEATLGKYLSDPAGFGDVMRTHGAVVSGSSALNIMLGTSSWSSKDLDIYVRKGETVSITTFLLRDGYTCHCPRFREPLQLLEPLVGYLSMLEDQHVRRILQFRKQTSNGTVLTIDIIESNTFSAISPITEFHCTAVMNYISGDAILCMYPILTGQGVAIMQDRHAKDRDTWIEKYTSRGFRVMESVAELRRPCGSACPTAVRTLGDPESLYLNFDQAESTTSPFPGTQDASDFGWPIVHWTLGQSRFVYGRLCPNPLCLRDTHDPLTIIWPEPFACITRDSSL
ncbi:hypothetical protein M422DRAFT_53146 [Sphaerobolus stellatus SS14]|uniref:Unplaced genomic scaffold SPHSTscaffold_159, whole genome shotgun sequence n=1 Tax=Sphaerobolus stellatus (strain SS14) TaxID=990650 RepID=A0A0C9TPH2_SPHS4|nr:hypothetical protein M422DRAFT_53146 [Sphaerobolus stellatus SS14]